jgi:regulator of RNase E activity RraA
MTYEVQTYDTTDNTVYYETVENAMSCEDARDVIAEKYPNRKVISVQEKNKEYDSMNLAIACANLLIARGDYVVDSITT